MRKIVNTAKTHPHVFLLARQLTRKLPPKAWFAEAKAIHAFVRDKIRYVKDVAGVETLQTPDKTLKIQTGDCDDKSMLVAALLKSIGHPVRFVVVGNAPNRFCHVYVETLIARKWIAVETTEPWELGEVRKKSAYRGVYYI